MLSKVLFEADYVFQEMIYPDENHSLGGVKRNQLRTMETFLDRSFRETYHHDPESTDRSTLNGESTVSSPIASPTPSSAISPKSQFLITLLSALTTIGVYFTYYNKCRVIFY